MGRLIREIRPVAVMMENVPGLAMKGKPLLNEFLSELKSLGYLFECGILQVADYGIPQNRRRLVVLAGQSLAIKLPEPTHAKNSSDKLLPWRITGEVIRNMPEATVFAEANENGGPQCFDWHVVRSLSSRNVGRLKQAKPGKPWRSIHKRLRPPCHQDKEAGFSNVYGRMRWDTISPTITGGCTTLSKGRFGHPEEDRTISVREAALLQTFPADYVFDTPFMEYACNIIGNALPCDFAEVLARQCADALRACRAKGA
jgi:DNA (cytosine-5)-methyltransferase 1